MLPRKQQVPTRWIDQGAHEAIEIVEVPNRYLAGITEVALKEYVADKTNWRKMLKNEIEDESLVSWQERLRPYIPEEVQEYFIENNKETHLNFPVTKYPEKPKSLNLIKTPNYAGKLVGIKGQYLIFEDQTVFNVRANEGIGGFYRRLIMKSNILKVALAQISPVWLNKEKTIEKIKKSIIDAAKENCELIVFGEALLPGYPFWLALTEGAKWDLKSE